MSSTPSVEKCIGNASSKNVLRDRIIGLSDWWNLHETSKSLATPLLDLRPFEEYKKQSLRPPAHKEVSSPSPDLVVVRIPISVVEKRSFELPARHVKFSVLVSESDLDRADFFLCGSNRKRPNPWKIVHVLLDTEEFWSKAQDMGMVGQEDIQESHEQMQKRQRLDEENSIHKTKSTSIKSTTTNFPMTRLWQPDPMVETVLFPLLAKVDGSKQQSLSEQSPRQVWDLAAGAGRDVAFLAEELLAIDNKHQLVAVDHRYNEKETNIVNEFWDRRGITNQTNSIKLNLSHWEPLEKAMESAFMKKQVVAMFCVRFWKPDLIKAIARTSSIDAGVVFGISHFCKPSVGAPWNFDHPSEKTVLERNQLSKIFEAQWDILHDKIALDSDHGRTMIHFVARRR
mmetsp:Transcript_26511/g.56811  ORF Transcript_26511/g.56811 Transcript_26511/m.56811 type:complete len:398 (+) Transcript_26511:116-1309(+)